MHGPSLAKLKKKGPPSCWLRRPREVAGGLEAGLGKSPRNALSLCDDVAEMAQQLPSDARRRSPSLGKTLER